MEFTHLHVHSHYSLLDGLPKIDEIVARCKELNMKSVALTDHGVLYGAVEFFQKAKKAGIKPIIGVELYMAAERMDQKRHGIDDKRYHIILLAKNAEGYKNLVQLVTKAHLDGFYYKPRIDKELLREYAKGIIATSSCIQGEIAQAVLSSNMEKARALVKEYTDIFGKDNFFLELGYHHNIPAQEKANKGLIELAKESGIGLVATNDVHYLKKEDAGIQDILTAIQTGHRLGDGDRLSLKDDDFSMRTAEEMAEYFSQYPEIFTNIQRIVDACNFEFELGKIRLPHYKIPTKETADQYLKKLCYENLEKRYGADAKNNKDIVDRLEFELSVIEKTGFASYFLIVQDFVNWAKQQNIVVGPGRGSAAGSIVSYVLNITNIDPLKYNLLFERFLNPDRISMPDIDLDFADIRRDEVINYVAQKYGRHNVAQIITFGTMAARAAIRDTGRALDYPYAYCDKVAKMIPFSPQGEKAGWLAKSLEGVTEFREFYHKDPEAKRLIDAAMKLEGVVRHASTHACGVVISDEPLYNIVPLQRATQNEEIIVTQYEMHSIEDLGLLKMDFLGLKNLTIIENTLNLIKKSKGITVDIDTLPLDDARTFRLCQLGKTTGVFQFESDGMKRYMKDLKPTEMEDLIAMVALYRPGPMKLIPDYIDRKHGRKSITYLHPKLAPILKNTYGVGIYQEQMMQIARNLGGFTLAQADILRKAIGKKIESLLEQQREKLIKGMTAGGIPPAIAQQIWELFPPFAEYGFNRSHAACYALIGYQTAYLKAHHPTEFMAALMTADLNDIERVAFLVEECKEMGIEILPPDVNESYETFTVVGEKKIRFGLNAVKNVGNNIVKIIIDERTVNGAFSSMSDFASRIHSRDLNKKSLESLVKCGVFDRLGERNKFLENMQIILDFSRDIVKAAANGQTSLFGSSTKIKPQIKLNDAAGATDVMRLAWEKELLGLYISGHPLAPYKEKLKKYGIASTKDVKQKRDGATITTGGVITTSEPKITKKGDTMTFAKLEDLTGSIELLVFPKVMAHYPDSWKVGNIMLVKGRTSSREGEPKIVVDEIKPINGNGA